MFSKTVPALVLLVLVILLVALAATSMRNPPAASPAEVQSIVTASVPRGALVLPNRLTSVKFAVIGDSGRGTPPQHEIAAQMVAYREQFRYPFVLMLGDNIYEGPATAEDYRRKFEEPYQGLLKEGVKFFAVLGNHDDPRQVSYAPFNMKGERYYSFVPPEDLLSRLETPVEFFALDSTNLDRTQRQWLDERLGASRARWKICFLHHPLYTSGRYRLAARFFRSSLEPILAKHGVDVALSGHEHIYQRSQVQGGVLYFVSGGAGSLRPGDGTPAPQVARTFAEDYHFMLMEIDGGELHFQAIARDGRTIDAGTLYQDGRDRKERTDPEVTPVDMPARR